MPPMTLRTGTVMSIRIGLGVIRKKFGKGVSHEQWRNLLYGIELKANIIKEFRYICLAHAPIMPFERRGREALRDMKGLSTNPQCRLSVHR